jgi:hypothetical protein
VEELLDPEQHYKVAAFRISTNGIPNNVYEADWEDVQAI